MSLREKLQADLDVAPWRALRAHVLRDAVILVKTDFDPVTVALAIAENQVSQMELWLKDQTIFKPTKADLDLWEQNGALFRVVVVQPYVVAQVV